MRKASAVLLAAAGLAAPLRAQSSVDTAGSGALIVEALERSEVMENLRYLSDVIGDAPGE
jgi:glycerol-3-phosphate cytidylyltransferase-like family protein